jgi:structural maintenance of chromosome 2
VDIECALPQKLATAESLAPGKVNLALSLIGYDEDVSAAMAYVFGDMLVCQDKETAQKVTFNKAVGVKSVTLEGDVYDPSGTLSGGAAPSSSGIISKVQEVNKLEKEIQSAQVELDDVLKNLNQAKASIEAYRKVKKEADLKQHEISLLEQEVQSSNGAKVSAI